MWGSLLSWRSLGPRSWDSAAVFAHAGYERSEPGRNEVLPSPPDRVDVWFTGDVRKQEGLYFLRVLDEQGAQATVSSMTTTARISSLNFHRS
ncbi:MAG: copper resistance protein CopC [Chloroflexi bacterium]|nr:copper resistance protein CopC [Chloroflexota bacterium]